jgi:hypothetical protein
MIDRITEIITSHNSPNDCELVNFCCFIIKY